MTNSMWIYFSTALFIDRCAHIWVRGSLISKCEVVTRWAPYFKDTLFRTKKLALGSNQPIRVIILVTRRWVGLVKSAILLLASLESPIMGHLLNHKEGTAKQATFSTCYSATRKLRQPLVSVWMNIGTRVMRSWTIIVGGTIRTRLFWWWHYEEKKTILSIN